MNFKLWAYRSQPSPTTKAAFFHRNVYFLSKTWNLFLLEINRPSRSKVIDNFDLGQWWCSVLLVVGTIVLSCGSVDDDGDYIVFFVGRLLGCFFFNRSNSSLCRRCSRLGLSLDFGIWVWAWWCSRFCACRGEMVCNSRMRCFILWCDVMWLLYVMCHVKTNWLLMIVDYWGSNYDCVHYICSLLTKNYVFAPTYWAE